MEINHLAKTIELTRQIDRLTTDFVDLQEVVKDVVFRNMNNCWTLKPEINNVVTGNLSQHLNLICNTKTTAHEVREALIESKLINLTETSQLDNTGSNNNE